MSTRNFKRNFFIVAGADAVKRIAEWIKHKFYTKTEIDDMLSAGMKYKVVNELPATGEAGTFYLVPKQSAGTGDVYDEYIYVDGSFEHIGSTEIDLSNYYTKTQADDLLDDKVDKVNGKGLSTNDYTTAEKNKLSSIENGAEVNVQSNWNQTDTSADDFIKNKPSVYTKSETDNLLDDKVDKVSGKGLSTEDFTTAEKTKLGGIEAGAEVNVQSDWNQSDSTKDDYIKNKPSVYTKNETDNLLDDKVDKESGKGLSTNDYTTAEKNKLGGIESGAEVNVQSDWNQGDSTKDDYIKNKPTLRQPATDGTSGQYLKSNGSGNAPSWETMDTAPTANSTKAVTSGGVKTALDGKQASVTITTNANTPTDNDTVIMQDSGNTGTTSFLRRKLSTLWEYFKGKDGYPEARLAWGGKHLTNATSPVDAALIPDLSANRAAFINPNCVDILYSEDGGTTWQDYRLTDWEKQRLLCDERSVIVGKRSSSQHADAQCMLRVFIHDTTSYFYAKIQKIAVYCATNGSEGCYCNVTGRKQVDINNNVDSWDTLADHVGMSGWSGWNIIQTSFITYGGSTTAYHINNYYGQIRLDFGISGPTTADNGAGLSISRIRMYGTECWGGSMSYLAKYGNPFVLREGKKCVFEGAIAIKDGTANQVLLANGDVMSLPVPINKGGTGSTTAIGAEYNILNQVADISTTLSDTRKIALCNQTKSASNGVFRWIALSNVWTWIKTHFDSSPTSGSSNGITSGGVYSALEEKVNLQPDFTASQIDYSAGNVGKWQKVLRFPEGADLVINMKKTAMGSDATSTLWFSSSSMGDSYTSLFGNHSVRFVHDGGYVFLVLACRKSTNEPIESYTFQIAHSSVPMSDIVAVTEASPITATPKEPSIVYRAPITTGAVSFNVTSSGTGSVYMSGHNDFLGNMTSEATNGVVVTMSGATEGQIYRFVFTRNITGGVTFKQSNVAYCTIQGDVNAGDTITLTAVSNTADGWLYEQESAGMTSTDGSVSIDYSSGIPDLSVEKVPFNNLVNKAMFQEGDSPNPLAVGEISEALIKTNDSQYPYACTYNGKVTSLSVNGGTSALYYNVTEGTTYSVNTGGDVVTYTAVGNGCIFALYNNIYSFIDNPLWVGSGSRQWNIRNSATYYVFNPTNAYRVNTHCFIIETPSLGEEITALDTYSIVLYYMLQTIPTINTAVGYMAKAIGEYSSAIGAYSRANSYRSIALGADAIVHCRSGLSVGEYSVCAQDYGIAIGSNSNVKATTDESGIAIGHGAECSRGEGVAIGWLAKLAGRYGVAIGSQSENNGIYGVAIGYNTKVRDGESIAIGNQSKANKGISISIGKNSRSFGLKDVAIGAMSNTGDDSGDENRPNLKTYTFDGVKFTYGANEVYNVFIYNGGDVTFSLNNTSYTLTSPSSYPRMLMVVNDSNAQYLHRSLSATIECDGSLRYNGGNPQEVNANIVQLSGSYYAVWIVYNSTNPYTATSSLRLYATITSTESEDEKIAIGTYNNVYDRTSVALGSYLIPIGAGQVVLGRYNKPTAGYLVIGNGTNSTTGRKNCLTIDSNERLKVCSYVGETQTIDMNQQTGSLGNITKSIYRIRWDDTGTINLTLGTGGCVEGQRVTIFAETNDVQIRFTSYLIPEGQFADFMFIAGAWRPYSGIGRVPTA